MDFYYLPTSPVCRSVLMTAKALGIELNKKFMNSLAGETLSPEFIKINPQHTIPTLVDDGFSVWESRAILIYLVEKYAKDDSLYPKCPRKQAIVNQRLYFDMGTLLTSFGNYFYPQFLHQQPADPELFKKLELSLEFLNTFLKGHQYAAGDTLTIADFALLASISTLEAINIDFSKYDNISRWYNHCKTVAPGWDENWEGCLKLREMIKK